VIEARLPEELRGQFGEFGQRTVIRITADRTLAQRLKDVTLVDFESEFFRWLIKSAKDQQFDGIYANIVAAPSSGVLTAFQIRWQNDQGEPTTDEFVTILAQPSGEIRANPSFIAGWLAQSFLSGARPNPEVSTRVETLRRLRQAAELHLSDKSTKFNHPNSVVLLAAADLSSQAAT
jgi:hypothetical protein